MGESARDRRAGHQELLAKLSLEEKISLLTGADFWSLRGHPGIGLRPVRTSDGPAGVRGPRWDERDTALNVPAPVALAATWDPRRAELMGSLLAAECRRKGVDVLLPPTINLQRKERPMLIAGRRFPAGYPAVGGAAAKSPAPLPPRGMDGRPRPPVVGAATPRRARLAAAATLSTRSGHADHRNTRSGASPA
jgi:hypothetical protein